MIAVIYPTHNRLDYTKITLPMVIDEVRKYDNIKELMLVDDNSTDGTPQYLLSVKCDKSKIYVHNENNSTYFINLCLEKHKEIKYIIKIDNDILIPKGYIDLLVKEMEAQNNKDVGFMAMPEISDLPFINYSMDGYINARWVGCVGIFRRCVFDEPINSKKKYFGFTKYQQDVLKREWRAVWLKGCGNTNLDMSCWSNSKKYVKMGYSRKLVSDERTVF